MKPTPALINKPKAVVPEGSTGAPAPVSPGSPTQSSSAGKGKRRSSVVAPAEEGVPKEKVITPQLRDLLKRDVYYRLERGEIMKHGGRVGS